MSIDKKINLIIDKLKKCDEIVGIALVGSYVKTSKPNDIDFLVLSTNNMKVKRYIKKIFDDCKTYVNDDSVRIDNYIDLEVGIGIYNIKKLNKQIEDYMLGKNIDPIYKNWNVVGWLPECLLCDLRLMKILYDNNFYMKNIKDKIYKYPVKLKDAIIKNCDIKINNLENRLCKAENLECQILNSEILSLRIRKKFAEKEIYFSGFKNIDNKLIESEIYIDE